MAEQDADGLADFIPGMRQQPANATTGMPGTPSEKSVYPHISDAKEFEALKPGTEFVDPEGKRRKKPWTVKSAEEYEAVPEGETFVDQGGAKRQKPKYGGVGVTTQTLYNMALTDKERENALAREYGPSKVKREENSGDFYVEGENGERLKPGHGNQLARGAAFLASEYGPVAGAVGGGLLGGAAGTAVEPGGGTIAGALAGAAVGGAYGQGFNDMILGLAGVYDRTVSEELINLGKAGAVSAVGEGVGRGVVAGAPMVKDYVTRKAGERVGKFLGVDKLEADKAKTAIEIAESGTPQSTMRVFPEAPALHKIEHFDRQFRTQDVLQQSARKHYETKGGALLDEMSMPTAEPLTKGTAKVSSEEAGQRLIDRARQEVVDADARLAAASRAAHTETAAVEGISQHEARMTGNWQAERGLISASLRSAGTDAAALEKGLRASLPGIDVNAPERVTAAATLHNGKVYTGPIHSDAVNKIEPGLTGAARDRFLEENYNSMIQGFVTSRGRFLGRAETGSLTNGADEATRAIGEKLRTSGRVPQAETLEQLRAAEAAARDAAQGVIDIGYQEIRRSVDKAVEMAKVGKNPGDTWRATSTAISNLNAAIKAKASVLYKAVEPAFGDHVADVSRLTSEAERLLESLPEPFRQKHPGIVQMVAKLAGKEGAEGEAREAVKVTYPQLHQLRSQLRQDISHDDLTPSIKDGVFKLFAKRVNEVIHDAAKIDELKPAVEMLDHADKFYAKQMPRFRDETLRAFVEGMKAGMPPDANAAAKLVFEPGKSEMRREIKKIVGKNLWNAIEAADTQAMLDASKTTVPGQVDGTKFIEQVVSRIRAGARELPQDIRDQAQRLQIMDGTLPITTRPGDTISELVQKIAAATERVKAAAKADPIGSLKKELEGVKKQYDAAVMADRRARAKGPLGFLYRPSAQAVESADKILKSEDLIIATAAKFGRDSAEFEMLRQVQAHRLLQVTFDETGTLASKLRDMSPKVQELVFPGVSRDNAITLGRHMEFLFGSGPSDMGASLAGASRVINPWKSLPGGDGAAKRNAIGLVLFNAPVGRQILGKYYALLTDFATKPERQLWLLKSLHGPPEAREAARQAARTWVDTGGAVGAGGAEASFQYSGGPEPQRRAQ